MHHMGLIDLEAFRRESCSCVPNEEGVRPNDCVACASHATIAYDAAAADTVISDFVDNRVNCLASGRKKQHKDDLMSSGNRSLSQYISSQRIKVECVFGKVKNFFKSLGKGTLIPSWWVPQIDKLVFICCVLHNFNYPCLS